jgi:hypothetical protein
MQVRVLKYEVTKSGKILPLLLIETLDLQQHVDLEL